MALDSAYNDDLTARFEPPSTVPLWLNGNQVSTKKTFDVISPATGRRVWQSSWADETDVLRAVDSAQIAYHSWRRTKPAERRAIFLKAYQLFIEAEERSKYISRRETAAPDGQNDFEYGLAKDLCLQMASLAGSIHGSVPETRDDETRAIVMREPPEGVYYTTRGRQYCRLERVGAGPATVWHFVSILHRAGLPAGCLNTTYHQTSDAAKITELLISHPSIKKVSFTGSTTVGRVIAGLCGRNLKPCLMELGGKAPAVVCEDANIELAARECAVGSFLHAGQICMSTERIIVNRKVAKGFKTTLEKTVNKFFGPSSPVPTLVQEQGVNKNKALIQDALLKGADLFYGDISASEEQRTQMRPAIVENVDKNMDIYYTESFGPTVSLIVVDNDDEALAIANDTKNGLSASVFTEDLRRGLRLARAIESGLVHINGMTVHDEAWLPHGGMKESGFGRNNAMEGLLEWVQTKTITWRD